MPGLINVAGVHIDRPKALPNDIQVIPICPFIVKYFLMFFFLQMIEIFGRRKSNWSNLFQPRIVCEEHGYAT